MPLGRFLAVLAVSVSERQFALHCPADPPGYGAVVIHSHVIDRRQHRPSSLTLMTVGMLEDHEARISALEATQGDYRAVLAAVNALGANQREHGIRLTAVETELADFRQETRARFGSVDEQLAEIKDLIIDRR